MCSSSLLDAARLAYKQSHWESETERRKQRELKVEIKGEYTISRICLTSLATAWSPTPLSRESTSPFIASATWLLLLKAATFILWVTSSKQLFDWIQFFESLGNQLKVLFFRLSHKHDGESKTNTQISVQYTVGNKIQINYGKWTWMSERERSENRAICD